MLCQEGARVLLVARAEERLLEAADECAAAGEKAGGQAESLATDLTEPEVAASVAREAQQRFGGLDVLVNSAGTARWRDLDEVPDEDWYAAWELNVMVPLRLMRATVPAMRERGWGRVVNVASTSGKRPSATMPEYSVAKAAELSLSRLYADRCAADGVLVNAVCPGPVKSELWMAPGGLLDQSKEMGGYDSRETALEAAGAKRPIGRLAEVDEIAGAITFLCSEHASYVAGAAWSVDGGTVQVII
jgi:3-oxoacyl-[acyl-carrier protein] reductase